MKKSDCLLCVYFRSSGRAYGTTNALCGKWWEPGEMWNNHPVMNSHPPSPCQHSLSGVCRCAACAWQGLAVVAARVASAGRDQQLYPCHTGTGASKEGVKSTLGRRGTGKGFFLVLSLFYQPAVFNWEKKNYNNFPRWVCYARGSNW